MLLLTAGPLLYAYTYMLIVYMYMYILSIVYMCVCIHVYMYMRVYSSYMYMRILVCVYMYNVTAGPYTSKSAYMSLNKVSSFAVGNSSVYVASSFEISVMLYRSRKSFAVVI